MVSKFLSKYYSYPKALQLRKDILNFQQLPTEIVFEAWERFKSCLQKCPDHRILLLHQILTFYHGITMIDQNKIMVAAGGSIMRKTPQEAYDLIENMIQHHYQWDSKVYEQVEVLGNDTEYTIQSVQHQLGTCHPNTFHYTYSDESDEDEPSEELKVQKLIHHLSGSPAPFSDSSVASPSPSLTSSGILNNEIFDEERDILLLGKLLNIDLTKDPPPLEHNNDLERDILFLDNLLKDEPLEAKKSKIDLFIREPTNTFLMGDE
ncbi:reverse transcriptase domain-containing protein [Tanacetum coccineum]